MWLKSMAYFILIY
uniref:Uncharacterized protein n=1 Tax=Anguilla anguilla TaxID=7936 RepID=A0A0E9VCX2_ANGAN